MRNVFCIMLCVLVLSSFAQTISNPSVMDNGGGASSGSGKNMIASIGQSISGKIDDVKILEAGYITSSLTVIENISENDSEKPTVLEIGSFSPNPFNSSTKLNIEIPKTSEIVFSVYSLKGKLIHERKEKHHEGYYSLNFQANETLNSGVYIYRLVIDDSSIEGAKVYKGRITYVK